MSITAPHGRAWTPDDLDGLPEGARYEILDGALVVSPKERFLNSRASVVLAQQIRSQLPARWFCERELDLDLGTSWVIADLAVGRTDASAPPGQMSWRAQDLALVVELESPTSRRRDRLLKPSLYAEARIDNYWRVVLEPQPRIVAYKVSEGAYVEVARLTSRGAVPLLGEMIELDPARLR